MPSRRTGSTGWSPIWPPPDELKTALTFFLTMPWVPIVYYGEEIGMRNIEDAPVKEGSFTSRNRSSCRTPMIRAGSTVGSSRAWKSRYPSSRNSDNLPTM